MKQRGRKSESELAVVRDIESAPPPAPNELDEDARELWDQIVASRPSRFYGPGDLPLLREFCHSMATLVPRVNRSLEDGADFKLLDARDKLLKLAANLASKLRICVSSRTRPDTAAMRDSLNPPSPKPWE